MWRPLSSRIAVAALGVALSAATLTGCGSSDDGGDGVVSLAGATATAGATPTATAAMSDQDKAFAFAACLRENGVDVPDPEIDGQGGIRMRMGGPDAKPIDPKAVQKAEKACKRYAPMGGPNRKLTPEQQEQLQKMAACMREHGIDMPDPGEDGRIEIKRRGPRPEKGAGPDAGDPKVEEAMRACQKYLPRFGGSAKAGS